MTNAVTSVATKSSRRVSTSRVVFRLALGGLTAAAVASTATAGIPTATTPSWADHFTSINTSLWYVSDGWSNGSYMLTGWSRNELATGSSGLLVTINKSPANTSTPYLSGEIQSRARYQYGYYQARIQAIPGGGTNTAFFTYVGATQGKNWNEIDIEILGKNTHAVQVTYHNGNQQVATSVPLSFDSSAAPHLYGFDWEPTYIRWYVDNVMVHQETGNHLTLPNEPQILFIDAWASNSLSSWMGSFTWPGHPESARVTCVAVQPAFTTRTIC
jgi:endo-1,3-1,4-beta-glycanase ExoK